MENSALFIDILAVDFISDDDELVFDWKLNDFLNCFFAKNSSRRISRVYDNYCLDVFAFFATTFNWSL